MADISPSKVNSNSFIEENSYKEKSSRNEKERSNTLNSSKSDSFFNNLNAEIKTFIENDNELSFSSNSNSDSQDLQINIDYLLDSKYWRASKDFNSEYENQFEKDIFFQKKNLFLLNEEKDLTKFSSKNLYKKEPVISEGSNKQSSQSNEDEETRIEHEHIHNISDSESPLNSLLNNESDENEINYDKSSNKEDKSVGGTGFNYGGVNTENILNLNKNMETNKNVDENNSNNLIGSNYLLNGCNFTNNEKLKFKNININSDSEFVFPYDPINYINQNNKNNSFFPGPFLSQSFCSFNNNYNLPSPLSRRSIISFNSNCSNHNDEDYSKKENKIINGQNNKFINSNVNEYNKQLNINQKDIIDMPLIMNQNNNQNIPMNYNCSKLNLNMTYYPKIQNIQNGNISSLNKQSSDKVNNNSNPEFNNKDNNSYFSEKKIRNNNNSFLEEQNNLNSMNNFNNLVYNNNKLKMNYKNIINKNMNNSMNKGNLKGEKQILNLDDIVTGKDTRTTVMIRNIPIKYNDEILNEAFVEFHGKYDCLYMPYDYEKNGNKGYAFINFTNPLHILYFYEKFNGKKWVHFESSKICELNCAHFQGVKEIQKHAKNFKELKKSLFTGKENNENIIIPSKYLFKLKKRFPKLQYTECKTKKIITIKSFE